MNKILYKKGILIGLVSILVLQCIILPINSKAQSNNNLKNEKYKDYNGDIRLTDVDNDHNIITCDTISNIKINYKNKKDITEGNILTGNDNKKYKVYSITKLCEYDGSVYDKKYQEFISTCSDYPKYCVRAYNDDNSAFYAIGKCKNKKSFLILDSVSDFQPVSYYSANNIKFKLPENINIKYYDYNDCSNKTILAKDFKNIETTESEGDTNYYPHDYFTIKAKNGVINAMSELYVE